MSIDSYDKSIITGGVTSNFIRFVVPSILGLLAISSAGIVDGIFVGNYIGATALAAVNLVVPLYSLFFGVCVMILVGAAVMAGKAVGKGDIQEASNLFSKSMIVVICYALICATLAFIYAENIAIFLGAKEDALPLTSEYIQTIAPFLFFMGMSYTLSTFAKVDNAPNFALAGLLAIAITNILLDALFIKMWGMGIFGAALASGISYLLGALILLLRYLSKTAQIRFIKPFGSRRVILRASYNGLSEFINEISGGLVVFTINWVLMIEVGIVGVAAFTVASYLLWFSVMIGYGIAEALGPLVSVNFGAKKPERISKFVNLGVVTSIFIGLLLSTALLLYPQELINIFLENGEVNTIEMTMGIIAVTWPIFLFNGINITISGYFTGMQAAKQSAMIALSRSLVLPIALILLFWNMFGLKGVFWALPTVEILTFALTAMLYSRLKPNALIGQDDKSSELIEEPA